MQTKTTEADYRQAELALRYLEKDKGSLGQKELKIEAEKVLLEYFKAR